MLNPGNPSRLVSALSEYLSCIGPAVEFVVGGNHILVFQNEADYVKP